MREAVRHVAKVEDALARNEHARCSLAASWMRSAKLHGLDAARDDAPRRVTAAEMARLRDEHAILIRAALPSLERLSSTLSAFGTSVLLANRDGIALERRGQPGDAAWFEAAGLCPGAIWSEAEQGTNGIGTAIIEQRPVTIHRDQHFQARNIGLSCMGAPIFDADGKLAGVLDVSAAKDEIAPAIVELIGFTVAESARRIEADVFRLTFPKARIIMVPATDRAQNALIAVDNDDLLIGATKAARKLLSIDGALDRRRFVAGDLLAEDPAQSLACGERSVLVQALARADGNVSAAARALSISRATMHRKLAELRVAMPEATPDDAFSELAPDLSQN
ncbi:MAG: GAF domain-containing protein [Rhizobiaceae bacterium]|nr:GAF domain-containing protein [Rhizobiaceae bacterium]